MKSLQRVLLANSSGNLWPKVKTAKDEMGYSAENQTLSVRKNNILVKFISVGYLSELFNSFGDLLVQFRYIFRNIP